MDVRPTREEIALRRAQTEAMVAFSRVAQQIVRRSSSILETRGFDNLTPSRANALIVLFNAKRPINARELARNLAITEVTVSRFIRKMEDDGWVERTPDPEDGRAMLLQPTAYAREQFPELVQVSNAVLDIVFGGFDASELTRMMEAIQRVQDNVLSDG